MKGKVEKATIERSEESGRYELSLTITIKKGLLYDRAQELCKQIWEEYKDKMLEITEADPTQTI